MAVVKTTDKAAGDRRAWIVALSLLALFAAALFVRTYWNVDAAVQGGHFVLSSGSDPYYEKRAIDYILANHFHQLVYDPLLNYPYGSDDPNPPLYDWSVATVGHLLAPLFPAHTTIEGAGNQPLTQEQLSAWWITEWAPAVYGALTVFPV
jgi:asparagine N-glycosylation enzyme membrane subunit Stt3